MSCAVFTSNVFDISLSITQSKRRTVRFSYAYVYVERVTSENCTRPILSGSAYAYVYGVAVFTSSALCLC